MRVSEQAISLLMSRYGPGSAPHLVSVPGRINLIGEHIDYHQLPVLPMAIQRNISIAFRVRTDGRVRTVSSLEAAAREFSLTDHIEAGSAGDWANYLKAAAVAVETCWPLVWGIDAAVASDLPVAAGLSSSSALLAGFAIALLRANDIYPTVEDLMAVLPEGEHFVGTRGGGMDHAAVMAARRGCALLVGFAPLELRHVPIPPDWSFLVAHSLTTAEKSGTLRAKYNALREDGVRALEAMRLPSYRAAVDKGPRLSLVRGATAVQRMTFLHVVEEAIRVRQGVAALENNEIAEFGKLLLASHASLRDKLGVSTPAIDSLMEAAMDAGAVGARLTGAGFGGCVIVLCTNQTLNGVRERLLNGYYSTRSRFDPQEHLFAAAPSAGALAG